jgi:hypothetical protein
MADKKKNIDQIINESFQSSDFDFDSSSWDNVKSKLDTSSSVDKIVYSAMNPTASSNLPEGAWDNMKDALDIETVWKRLEKRTKRRPILFWWKVAGVAILLSLISYELNYKTRLVDDYQNGVNRKVTSNKTIPKNVNEIIRQSIPVKAPDIKVSKKEEVYYQNNIDSKDYRARDLVAVLGEDIDIDKEKTAASHSKIINEIDRVRSNSFKTIDLFFDKSVVGLADYSDSIVLPDTKSRLTIGIVGELNNTWISDVETRLGYSKSSLVYNDFSISPSYGFYVDYKINPGLIVSSEMFVNSIMVTKNNLYRNGELTKKETDLEYFKSSLFVSKNIEMNKLKVGNSLRFSGGGYFSYLKRSFIKYNNVITKLNRGYKLFDYGLKAGISHNLDFKRINFSYGVETTYGLNNVFDGEETPSYLNTTRNISYGFNIKLGYRL